MEKGEKMAQIEISYVSSDNKAFVITETAQGDFMVAKYSKEEIILRLTVGTKTVVVSYDPSDPTFEYIQHILKL